MYDQASCKGEIINLPLHQSVQVLAYCRMGQVRVQFRAIQAPTLLNLEVCLISFYERGVNENKRHVIWVRGLCVE